MIPPLSWDFRRFTSWVIPNARVDRTHSRRWTGGGREDWKEREIGGEIAAVGSGVNSGLGSQAHMPLLINQLDGLGNAIIRGGFHGFY